MVICLWVVSLSCLNMANAAAEHTRQFLEVNRIVHTGLQHPQFLAEPSGHRSPRRGPGEQVSAAAAIFYPQLHLHPDQVAQSPGLGCIQGWSIYHLIPGNVVPESLSPLVQHWIEAWCAPSGMPVMWEQTDGCLSCLCIPPWSSWDGAGTRRGRRRRAAGTGCSCVVGSATAS